MRIYADLCGWSHTDTEGLDLQRVGGEGGGGEAGDADGGGRGPGYGYIPTPLQAEDSGSIRAGRQSHGPGDAGMAGPGVRGIGRAVVGSSGSDLVDFGGGHAASAGEEEWGHQDGGVG